MSSASRSNRSSRRRACIVIEPMPLGVSPDSTIVAAMSQIALLVLTVIRRTLKAGRWHPVGVDGGVAGDRHVGVCRRSSLTLTDCALSPFDSRKLCELTTESAASGLIDPTAPVNVTSPAPAVIVNPSAVAVLLSTVLANVMLPPSEATALGLVRNVCVWKTMSPPVELTVVPIWIWSFAVTSSAANVDAPPLKTTGAG